MSESTKLKNIDIVHKAEAERLLKKVSLTVNLCMPEVKTAKEENILLCENLNLFDNNTCCCVKKKKIIILNNISCSIKPGMTAIMEICKCRSGAIHFNQIFFDPTPVIFIHSGDS
ncbi:hypothetical protein A3Q56_05811, partial [Intoshia linei]